jgi:hypothetical protein
VIDEVYDAKFGKKKLKISHHSNNLRLLKLASGMEISFVEEEMKNICLLKRRNNILSEIDSFI